MAKNSVKLIIEISHNKYGSSILTNPVLITSLALV